MKSKIAKSTSLILVCSLIIFSLISSAVSALGFSDLNPTHWCYEKIMKFLDKDYVCGYEDGTFKPDQTITRAEYVKIVNNFFGYVSENDFSGEKFSDVSKDSWYAKYVFEAVERGYITGYPDGTFKPQEPIRRQEATVILSRILGIDDEEYPVDHKDGMMQYCDSGDIEEWAYKAIHSYSVYNFINGYEDGSIRLLQNVTRAETVELLNRLEEQIVIDREEKPNKGGGGSTSSRSRYIYYYNDGIEIAEYKTKVSHGKTTLVRAMGLSKDDYNFVGWKVRGGNKIYQPGTSTDKIVSDLKLDAVWEPIYYQITYVSVSGDNIPSGDSVKSSENYIITSKEPTRIDYEFVGWKESGDTKIYIANDVIEKVTSNHIYEALWTRLGISIDPEDETVPSGDGEIYELLSDDMIMYVGESGKLIAELNPEHSETKYEYEIIEKSNDDNISMSGDSIIALKKTKTPVQVKVTATTAEGFEIERIINVTVLDREITVVIPSEKIDGEDITVDANGITIKVGEIGNLEAIITPDAKEKEYEWESASEKLDIIDGATNRKVTIRGVEAGETTITVDVKIGNQIISKDVKVTIEPIEVIINHIFPIGSNDVKNYGPDKVKITNIEDVITVMDYKYKGEKADWYSATTNIEEVAYNSDSLEATITYVRNNTTYTVEHYKEDLNADTYTLVDGDTETKNGTAGELTSAEAKTTYDGFTPKTVEQQTILADGTTVVKIYYTRNSYKVVYFVDGEEKYSDTYEFEEEITPRKDEEKTGYTFSGWTEVPETMPTDDVKIEGAFTINEYTLKINYLYKDGSVAESVYEAEVEYNANYSVNSPKITGYTADKLVVAGKMPAKSVEVDVTYEKASYTLTVKYIYEDGTEAANAKIKKVKYNEEYSVNSPNIVGYKPSKDIVNGIMPAEDQEITVTYSVKKYNVYFEEDGGETVEDILNVSYGETVSVEQIATTKNGYNFAGWKKGTKKVTEFVMPNEDVTLNAIWEWIEPDVDIEKFVSINYPDTADSIKAEPGSTIEYEMVIKNNESSDVIISVDFNKNITLLAPTSLDDISLRAGESVTVKVKVNVPNTYEVAKDEFTLVGTVEAEYNGTTGEVDNAKVENKIEKSSTAILKNPEAKNVILVLDLSGSMNAGTNSYREDRIGSLKVEAKKFVNKLKDETVGEIYLTMVGIGGFDGKGTGYISGTLEYYPGYYDGNADAVVLGTYTLNDWDKLTSRIDKLTAFGGTNITGAMDIVNDILTREKYRSTYGIKYSATAKDYVVILTDGANGPNGEKRINGTETGVAGVRMNADYLAAIGFGSEAANTASNAYSDLRNITNDVSKIYSAAKQTDLDKAFSDIANSIGKDQSIGGYTNINVTDYNGNIYPIIVTKKVGTEDVELFRIIQPTTSVEWTDGTELIDTKVTITDAEVKLDLSGTAFSDKEDLKIKIGSDAPKYIATFMLENGEENIVVIQEEGTKLIAPSEIKNGENIFVGWEPSVPELMPAENVEYKAKWQAVSAPQEVEPEGEPQVEQVKTENIG